MPVAARFAVAVVVAECGITFRTPVVGEFEDAALPRDPAAAFLFVSRNLLVASEHHEEVEAEFAAFVVAFAHQGHAEDAGVEIQRFGRVFHAQHGVVVGEALGGRVMVVAGAVGVDAGEGHGFLRFIYDGAPF